MLFLVWSNGNGNYFFLTFVKYSLTPIIQPYAFIKKLKRKET